MWCEKVRYASSGRAERALSIIRKQGVRAEKKPTRVYLCPWCNGWHLTSEAR